MKTNAALLITCAAMLLITSCSQSPVAPVPSPEWSWSVFGTVEPFVSVSGTSSDNIYALGGAGTLSHYDGTRWSASLPFNGDLDWTRLWCISRNDVYAVGLSNLASTGGDFEYGVYHFDGSVVSPTVVGSTAPIDLWGDSRTNVYAVGGGGMIEHYDGSLWQPMESGTTEDIVAIWGLPSGDLFAASAHAVVYYDGSSWTGVFTTDEILKDIWASSREDVYAVGQNGAVLHYDGQSWALTRLSWASSGLHPDLLQVVGTASNDVYAGGEAATSTFYHFDGVSWQGIDSLAPSGVVTGLWATATAGVYVVGYDWEEGGPFPIIHYDGATSHRESTSYLMPYNQQLYSIYGTRKRLYVGGDDCLFRYEDGVWRDIFGVEGDNFWDVFADSADSYWVAVNDGWPIFFGRGGASGSFDVVDVWGNSIDDVFLVGDAGHIDHFNGSTRASMESNTTANMRGVWGRSGNDVYAVGDSGTVVHYDGQSWQPMQSNTTENLAAIWGNAEIAVAVGTSGTILHCKDGQCVPMSCPISMSLTGVWGASSTDIYAVGPRAVLHYDGSRWGILSDTLGGKQIWGRAGDGVYMLAVDNVSGTDSSHRILRYGPPMSPP